MRLRLDALEEQACRVVLIGALVLAAAVKLGLAFVAQGGARIFFAGF